MRRIAIAGPESSGKTTLCEALAAHYAAPFVEEVARDHLSERNGQYVEEDLRVIASLQHDVGILRERDGWRQHEKVYDFMVPDLDPFQMGSEIPRIRIPEMPLMLFDTDMITISIWSREKFGRVHPDIEDLVQRTHYDHWLLCRPDIPWQSDPLRENPHDRDRLFAIYEATLQELERPYTIIEGAHGSRVRKAIEVIDELIATDPVKEREV